MALRRLVLRVLMVSIIVAVTFAAPTPTPTTMIRNTTMPVSLMKAAGRSRLFFQITTLLQNRATNSTKTILQRYPYIGTNSFLKEPLITLGLNIMTASINCRKMSDTDKLGFLHAQFATFQGPIDLAYQYEINQGAQNTDLAESIRITKYFLDDTVNDIFKVFPKNQKIPSGRKVTKTDMDTITRLYLKDAQKITGVPPIDANVKSFRNYIIIFTLGDIIMDITRCIPDK